MQKPTIAVFGSTGAQGGSLAKAILEDPARRFEVRAVTRKPDSAAAKRLAAAGARIVQADMDDERSLDAAMEGAAGAFCVTNFWEHFSPEREVEQAGNMARAAERNRVAHVVWSTLDDTRQCVPVGSGRMPVLMGRYNVPHFDAKGEANRLFVDRVPTTLLYTSFYWDNLVHFGMHPQRGADGRLSFILPMDDAKLPGIAAEDIGPCALEIFARGGELVGKSVGIAGEHLTGAQMAEQLTLALGEPVAHAALSPDEYAALGFPGADDLANMFRFNRDFEREFCGSRSISRTRELHPGAQTFARWLQVHKSRIPIAK
jgi:uncharacterized protein YbjT (DUF2867 family)